MGLFSNKCNALIDKTTGRALSGAELEEAKKDPNWPVCGHDVSKRARFCSKCGHGAPDGWFKCPQCGKWVGNDSKFCPHCNHPLFPAERIDLAGGVWARKPGEFARRFDLDDVRFIKENGLMVQEGTVAVLLDGGKAVKELGSGRHHPTGTLRSINWFGNPPPRSAVMVDAGECVFRVDFTGKTSGVGEVASAPLRSAEELEVGCVAEITLRFVSGRGSEFVANVMKETRSVSMKDVCGLIYENALSAVRDLCTQSKIEDLVKDPERRERFEDGIVRALRDNMKGWGLEIVRAGAVEFYGAAYEEVRAKYGELEKDRRLVEFARAKLEVLAAQADQNAAADKRDALRDRETWEYLEQLAQEKGLSKIEREQEMAIAVRVSKGEISAVEAKLAAARELEDHAKAMTALAHKLELDLSLKNYGREQALADAEQKAKLNAVGRDERLKDEKLATAVKGEKLDQAKLDDEIERIRIARELWESDKWLDVRRKKDSIKNEGTREKLEMFSGRDAQTIAAVMASEGDSTTANTLLAQEAVKARMAHETEMAGIQAGMSAEQILAGGAAKDPNAAKEAYARAAEAGEKASAQVLEERRKIDAEIRADREKTEGRIAGIAEKAVEKPTTVVQPAAPVTNMQH